MLNDTYSDVQTGSFNSRLGASAPTQPNQPDTPFLEASAQALQRKLILADESLSVLRALKERLFGNAPETDPTTGPTKSQGHATGILNDMHDTLYYRLVHIDTLVREINARL